jgi:hypothetical protein
MKALYAYFGLLDLHDIDSPGHSFYQLGLLDSIREEHGVNRFDFFSYYPKAAIHLADRRSYPDDGLGIVFRSTKEALIENEIDFEETVKKIRNHHYDRLYLKARFRNLSTLSKKWLDAWQFETFIQFAVETGYSKEEIVILDTDLSLPDRFYEEYGDSVTVIVPSIDIPGISADFLEQCVDVWLLAEKKKSVVYYGNIDTSAYKAGNSKSEDLRKILSDISGFDGVDLTLICKGSDSIGIEHNTHVERGDRARIWSTLSESAFMLNVTKPKYEERRFIPARIYEAMIFGMVPISHGFHFLCPAFSFKDEMELKEILKYLVTDCDSSDLRGAYRHFVSSYRKYVDSLRK